MKTKTFGTITKKRFMELYKANRIGLVASLFKCTKEDAMDRLSIVLKNGGGSIPHRDLTMVDIKDYGQISQTKVYDAGVQDINMVQLLYFVETTIDDSQDKNTSCNDTYSNTMIYILL